MLGWRALLMSPQRRWRSTTTSASSLLAEPGPLSTTGINPTPSTTNKTLPQNQIMSPLAKSKSRLKKSRKHGSTALSMSRFESRTCSTTFSTLGNGLSNDETSGPKQFFESIRIKPHKIPILVLDYRRLQPSARRYGNDVRAVREAISRREFRQKGLYTESHR